MDYQIIQDNSLEALETSIKKAMENGYRPQGGVQVVTRGSVANVQLLGYIQAIVKFD